MAMNARLLPLSDCVLLPQVVNSSTNRVQETTLFRTRSVRSFRHTQICAQKKSASTSKGGFGAPVNKKATQKTTCPCGSRTLYHDCCGKYHEGLAKPPTAEALMRSRYSAYSKGLVEYVVDTTHPDNPLLQKDDGESLRKDVVATCKKISWDKLVVLETEDVNEEEAFVTFQTYFKVRGQQGQRSQGFHTQTFIEKSRFLRVDGMWLYENGEQDWEQNQWVGGL